MARRARRKRERDLRLLQLELAERPGHPFTLFNLGMTYSHIGRHQEAVACSAEHRGVRRQGFSGAKGLRTSCVLAERNPVKSKPPASVVAKAWSCFRATSSSKFRWGVLLQRAGRLREAAAAYQEVLSLPALKEFASVDRGIRGFKTRQNLAVLYGDLGDLERSEEQWRRSWPRFQATVQDGEGWDRFWCVAAVMTRLGSWSGTCSSRRRWKRRPDCWPAGLRRHRVVLARPGRNWRRSPTDQRILSLSAGCANCCLNTASRSLRGGAAPTHAARPADASAPHNLGTVCLRTGRFGEAVQCYREALRLRPAHAQTWLYLGCSLQHDGALEEAVDSWREALRLAPHDIEGVYASDYLSLAGAEAAAGANRRIVGRADVAIPAAVF